MLLKQMKVELMKYGSRSGPAIGAQVRIEDGRDLNISWLKWRKISKGKEAVFLHKRKMFGDVFWYFGYKGRVFRSEIEIPPSDIAVIIDKQDQDRREKVTREFDSIKAQAEFDGFQRHSIPKEAQIFVWNRDNGQCIECGSKENLEFDHIIPVSKGGSNTARNIQLLCETCNRKKSDSIGA